MTLMELIYKYLWPAESEEPTIKTEANIDKLRVKRDQLDLVLVKLEIKKIEKVEREMDLLITEEEELKAQIVEEDLNPQEKDTILRKIRHIRKRRDDYDKQKSILQKKIDSTASTLSRVQEMILVEEDGSLSPDEVDELAVQYSEVKERHSTLLEAESALSGEESVELDDNAMKRELAALEDEIKKEILGEEESEDLHFEDEVSEEMDVSEETKVDLESEEVSKVEAVNTVTPEIKRPSMEEVLAAKPTKKKDSERRKETVYE